MSAKDDPKNPDKLGVKLLAKFREQAAKKFHDEGTIEIDDEPTVSCADPEEGAYVQAWVWVPRDEIKL